MLQILITTICTILSYKHLNSIILCVKFFRVRREKCRVLRFSSSPLSFFLSFFLLFLFIFFFRYSTVRVNFMVINTFQCTDTLSGNTGLSFYTHQKKRKKRKKKKESRKWSASSIRKPCLIFITYSWTSRLDHHYFYNTMIQLQDNIFHSFYHHHFCYPKTNIKNR